VIQQLDAEINGLAGEVHQLFRKQPAPSSTLDPERLKWDEQRQQLLTKLGNVERRVALLLGRLRDAVPSLPQPDRPVDALVGAFYQALVELRNRLQSRSDESAAVEALAKSIADKNEFHAFARATELAALSGVISTGTATVARQVAAVAAFGSDVVQKTEEARRQADEAAALAAYCLQELRRCLVAEQKLLVLRLPSGKQLTFQYPPPVRQVPPSQFDIKEAARQEQELLRRQQAEREQLRRQLLGR